MFAVHVTEARPEAFVVAAPGRVADAPEPGAVKVTVAPETGLPSESLTNATSELEKVVPTCADCPEPEDTVTLAGVWAIAPTVRTKRKLVRAVRKRCEPRTKARRKCGVVMILIRRQWGATPIPSLTIRVLSTGDTPVTGSRCSAGLMDVG